MKNSIGENNFLNAPANIFILNFLFIFIITGRSSAQEWNEPYFECVENRPDNKINCTGPSMLDVEEEILTNFTLVKLTYNGPETPGIQKFHSGNNYLLGAVFEQESDNFWYIKITNRQDYENPNQRLYFFDVYIEGQQQQSLKVNIINIFDNKPEVRYIGPDIPCKWKAYEINTTNCTVNVRDIDGLLNNKITMSVKGNNNAEDHFDLKEKSRTEYELEYLINIKKELDYDESQWFTLNIEAADIANNIGHGEASFSVINIPHNPPRWIKPLVTANFLEKTQQNFSVLAISGDIGITESICYKVEFVDKDYSDIISINSKTGNLNVKEIDRDARQQEIYKFELWAFKCNNETSKTSISTILIVEDINDNLPVITIDPKTIQLYENTTQSIDLNVFRVSDIDLGEHATYNVYLEKADEAFDIVPNYGYQNASFQLTIKDKDFLDYENDLWRNIEVMIVAQENNITSHIDRFTLHINLINWNDEPPYFYESEFSTELKETVPNGYVIYRIEAVDRDIDDFVSYGILGNFYGIEIDKESGIISTTFDDVFDYDRQKTVIIQVQATDNLTTEYSNRLHSAFTQLTINVKDVNNKTPELRLSGILPNVTENCTDIGTITKEIRATDPDTDAKLVFKIDWNLTYATKSGTIVKDKSTYEECFVIEPHPKTINEVYGHLKLNPELKTIVDYEMYDTIYLFIIVTDENTVVNEPSSNATLTVIVDDINDCAPEFIGNTLGETRVVFEEAVANTPAGNLIVAKDRDGPQFNVIQYYIRAINDTNDTWIEIDKDSGVLTVLENAKIDCDIPLIDGLFYEIRLFDGLWNTTGNIMINVTDINNKVPMFKEFNRTVEISEDSESGTYIKQILGYDLDRDAPHNVLEYSINFQIYKDLERFFQVDRLNGTVFVQLQGDSELDRDHNITEHIIHVDVRDNYLDPRSGRRNIEYVNIRVVLLDVNDNAPIMPSAKDFKPKINENVLKDYILEDPTLIAVDIDQPDHPNSWVSFEILKIYPGEETDPNIKDFEDLFTMIGDYKKKEGKFVANKDLKGYYGNWNIHIRAYDLGVPEQSSNETFILEVLPYNFHEPEIIYPNVEVIRLRHDQPIDGILLNTDKTKLRSFEAYDPDGGVYGNVSFDIISETEYFIIKHLNRSHSNLSIRKKIDIDSYTIKIKAKDGGGLESNPKIIEIFIVDMDGDPYFEENTFKTDFTESDIGLEESRIIPEAVDPKNNGIINDEDKIKVYYYLDKNYNSNLTEMFSLDKEERILKLNNPLNRTEQKELTIKIIATNTNEDYLTSYSEKSELFVEIRVNDADPRPNFDEISKKYGASITVSDYEGKAILEVHAADSDIPNSKTIYKIIYPIEAHGNNIESIKNKMFELNEQTGVFTLKKKVESSMTGFFMFNVTAEDNNGNKDEANVKIYIIAESNRISFTFLSDYSVIKENFNFIKNNLREQYGYEGCNIDDISNSTKTNEDGSVTEFVNVRVHFIQNNEPIDGIEIVRKTNQQLTNNLKNIFIKKNIYLNGIQNEKNSSENKIKETTSWTFIIISIVLGVLCAILVVAFVLKTKSLNRQLKAFAPPEFGSRSSDLNRLGVPATNIFSVEGSNPVINSNNIDEYDDSSSVDSDGSDFVGINNDVNFMKKKESVSSRNSSVKYSEEKENNIENNNFEKNDEKVMRF